MRSWIRTIAPTLLGVSALVLFAGSLSAQGVTSAAVVGRITQAGGVPVDGAVVTVLNTSTGGRWQAVTRASGRYFLENVATGGPFTIEARGIGFQPARKTGITLTLGQRYTANFELSTAPVELEELAVSAAINPLINRAKTGPTTTISDTAADTALCRLYSIKGLSNSRSMHLLPGGGSSPSRAPRPAASTSAFIRVDPQRDAGCFGSTRSIAEHPPWVKRKATSSASLEPDRCCTRNTSGRRSVHPGTAPLILVPWSG